MSRLRARLRDAVHIGAITGVFDVTKSVAELREGSVATAVQLHMSQPSDEEDTVNRLVVGMRHVDWALTLPLLAIEVFLLLRHPHSAEHGVRRQMWTAAACAFFCIIFGYMAHPLSGWFDPPARRVSFAVATLFFAGMYVSLYLDWEGAVGVYESSISATERKWIAGTVFAGMILSARGDVRPVLSQKR